MRYTPIWMIFLMVCCMKVSLHAQTVNQGILAIKKQTIFSSLDDIENLSYYDFASGTVISVGEIWNEGEFYVYGDYKNEGNSILSDASFIDSTFFVGISGQQMISGDSTIGISNAIFSNSTVPYTTNPASPTYILANNMVVSSSLTLLSGIIDAYTNGGSITLNDRVVAASDNSYVFGEVIRPGSSEFSFPIGDGGYLRPLVKAATSLPTDTISAVYHLADPGNTTEVEGTIVLLDQTEYWDLKSNQANVDVDITLNWDDRTTASTLVRDAAAANEWAIARWDEASKQWVPYESTVDQANRSITAKVNQSGRFTLAKVILKANPAIVLETKVLAVDHITLLCDNDSISNLSSCDVDQDYVDVNQIGVDTMKSRAVIKISSDIETVQIDFAPEPGCVGLYSTSYLVGGVLTPITSGSKINLTQPLTSSDAAYEGVLVIDRNMLNPNAPRAYLDVQVHYGSTTLSQKILFSDDFDNDGFLNVTERSVCIKTTNGIFNEWYATLPDDDADGDGIPNVVEAGGYDNWSNLYYVDSERDCIPDFLDTDSNNDGVPDTNEKFTGNQIDSSEVVKVRKAVSPNGDGLGDDQLMIENINHYPNNEFTLFDRSGRILYQVNKYNNQDRSFRGYPNKGSSNKLVPVGTYYYYLRYHTKEGMKKELSGFVEVRY